MYKLIVVLFLSAMALIPYNVKAQEITDPSQPIVTCASTICTDPLYFFEYKMYFPTVRR